MLVKGCMWHGKTWVSPELEESQWTLTQATGESLQLTNMPAERKMKSPESARDVAREEMLAKACPHTPTENSRFPHPCPE